MATEPIFKDQLPDDLVEFLKSNRILEYDSATCEIGLFTIRSFEEIEEIQMVVRGEDAGSSCVIRALDLVKSCEGYDPQGIVVFIPALRKYGSYDGEHKALITFRGMSWSDFLAAPARYVNAAWEFDPEIAEATFSEAAVDRLVEVYSAANGLEAHSLRLILENKGIRSQVVGESLQTAGGDLPLGATLAPRIWVREGDAGLAREIIETHSGRPPAERAKPSGFEGRSDAENVTFACQECGKSITFAASRRGHVENCPHCGSYVDVPNVGEEPFSAVSASAANEPCSEKGEPPKLAVPQRRRATWLEVLAILALAYVPYLLFAIATVSGCLPRSQPSPFAFRMAELIVAALQSASPVLIILTLGGESLREFGIVRPRWVIDALLALLIYAAAAAARQFALSLLPLSMLRVYHTHTVPWGGVKGLAGALLLFIACGAGSFAEELVMRAYLITRFRRLLSSTWIPVIVTTLLFASYHAYQGPDGVISAAASGLVFGVSFCLCRRLWPICLAHAAHNVLIYLR